MASYREAVAALATYQEHVNKERAFLGKRDRRGPWRSPKARHAQRPRSSIWRWAS
jgi:hypothetical protein